MSVNSQEIALIAQQLAAIAGVFDPKNAAAIALIVLIGNAKLLVKLAIRTYGWLAGAMR